MKRSTIIALVAVASLLVFSLIAWAIRNSFEWTPEKITTGYQKEAQRNPYLALERWLKAMGRNVNTQAQLRSGEALPPHTDTLIIVQRSHPMTPQQADELVRWVEAGGYLIFDADLEHEPGKTEEPGSLVRKDALLQKFGLRLQCDNPADMSHFLHSRQVEPISNTFEGDGPEKAYKVERIPKHSLIHSETGKETRWGSYSEDRGRGHVRVFTELRYLRNRSIGRHDHVDYFWRALGYPHGKIWIVRAEEAQNLFDWIAQKAQPCLLGLAILLGLSIWRFMPRFGPAALVSDDGRRSLMEHVQATGRFLWREGCAQRLVQRTRTAMHKRLALSHPAWTALPDPELRVQLSNLSGLSELEIMRALHKNEFSHPREFTDVIRNLESLRKIL